MKKRTVLKVFLVWFLIMSSLTAFPVQVYSGSTTDELLEFLTIPFVLLDKLFTWYTVHNAVDYLNPITRNFFLKRIHPSHGGKYTVDQICDIWEYCYNNWIYVSDPYTAEYVARASETIQNGLRGDCEDFAILIAAGIKVIGGASRIIFERKGNEAHGYAEVYIGRESSSQWLFDCLGGIYPEVELFYIHRAPNNEIGVSDDIWLNLDYTTSHPGGPFMFKNGTIVAIYNF
ncbi:TPA: hypothetical protein DIT45_00540 [Candidatus Acetothermia bacterium]|nr:hypothetical protein [Candidatus Acetothermia bacterium]